ncbi:unnamed protein product, partial [Polarella glacialis]
SHEEGALRDIFDRCDTNGDGRINKRELIKVCRSSKEVAQFLGLPQVIRQEGGSREAFESRFQSLHYGCHCCCCPPLLLFLLFVIVVHYCCLECPP